MRELFKAFEAVDKVIIATNGYQHYYGTATTSTNNLCRFDCILVLHTLF